MKPFDRLAAVQRDIHETGFSKLLDSLVRQLPDAVCAVFIDGEGETVDLASRVDPFDARIAGAEMAIALHTARACRDKLQEGALLEMRIEGARRSMIVRMVSEGYDLVVVVEGSAITGRVAELTASTAIALVVEAGLDPPPSYAVLRSVEERPSKTGLFVPTVFEEAGSRRRVEAILGHRDDGNGVVKFLVRLEDGEELMVVHDRASRRWLRS
jgi:predicted regulator of Ras-like GTPase activity (Roadblock/LC7/MglB family)